jgi:hypothetical protein
LKYFRQQELLDQRRRDLNDALAEAEALTLESNKYKINIPKSPFLQELTLESPATSPRPERNAMLRSRAGSTISTNPLPERVRKDSTSKNNSTSPPNSPQNNSYEDNNNPLFNVIPPDANNINNNNNNIRQFRHPREQSQEYHNPRNQRSGSLREQGSNSIIPVRGQRTHSVLVREPIGARVNNPNPNSNSNIVGGRPNSTGTRESTENIETLKRQAQLFIEK